MRAAVPAALHERQVVLLAGVVHALGREAADRLGQQVGIVWHLDALRDLRLRLFRGVQYRLLAFDERPFERLLRAVDIDALAVLPGDVEERADDAGAQVGVAKLDMAR